MQPGTASAMRERSLAAIVVSAPISVEPHFCVHGPRLIVYQGILTAQPLL